MTPAALTFLALCQVSAMGVSLVKKFEGFSETAYWDSNGWAVGYGSHGPDIKQGTKWNEHDAAVRMELDLNQVATEVCRRKPDVTQNQLDALASLGYNIGIGRLIRSGVFKYPRRMLKYTRAGGVVLRGLERRRMAEYQLYLRDDSDTYKPIRSK